MTKQLLYGQGTAFLVPVSKQDASVGVVARMDGAGIILGYFFGPRISADAGSTIDLRQLKASDAVLVARAGDLGLVSGAWPILGSIPSWDEREWPLPDFGYTDPLFGKHYRTAYERVGDIGERTPATKAEVDSLPDDGLAGAAFVQQRLSRILRCGTSEVSLEHRADGSQRFDDRQP